MHVEPEITQERNMVARDNPAPIPKGTLPDLPVFDPFPPCPECDRPSNREHFAIEDCRRVGQAITHLFCAHCDVGLLTLWFWKYGRWHLDFTLRCDGDKVPAFLKRLEELTCVAA